MTTKSLVMLEKKDNRAPDDYMELVLKEYAEHSVWGMLTIDLTTAKDQSLSTWKEPPDMETIKQGREMCSDPAVPIAYWFYKNEKPIHPDSMQPFVIAKDKEENPLIVALAAGEFKKYSDEGGISGAAYYCFEYLNSQAEDWVERAGGDVEKLDSILESKGVLKNLTNSLGDGDCLIIALADEEGSVRAFSNTSLNNFDWGFTSDTLGWEKQEIPLTGNQDSKEELGKEEPKLTGMAARWAAKKAKEQEASGTTKTSSISSFIPTPVISGTRTQDTLKPPEGATIDTHPQWFYQLNPESAKNLKEKQIRRAYQDALGWVPQNFMDCPVVRRTKPTGISTEPIKDFTGLRQVISTDSSKSKGEAPPIITAQTLKFINEEVLPKYFDVDKRLIKPPYEAPKVEDRLAMFSDVTGLGDAVYGAPVALRRELIATPDAFLNWTIEMSATIINLKKEINGLRAENSELKKRQLKSA